MTKTENPEGLLDVLLVSVLALLERLSYYC